MCPEECHGYQTPEREANTFLSHCSIPQFRLTSTPTQYDKVQLTSSTCVVLSLVTINVCDSEIYLQYVFYNLLVHILISSQSFYVLVTVLYSHKVHASTHQPVG